ncbi:MAG: DUF1127 domain-containing protein [Pseudomonadota bacterium]
MSRTVPTHPLAMPVTTEDWRHQVRAGLAVITDQAKHALAVLDARWRHRATVTALSGLSDAALKDIGLHRSEISSVAADLADRRNRR